MTDATTRWMDAYTSAWESNDPAAIRSLFSDDAVYFTEPWTQPWRGVDAIVDGWLGRSDDPGNHEFTWAPLVVTDAVSIVQGTTAYLDGRTYSNLWVIRLDADGRARKFTEWWMDQASPS